MRRSRRLIAAIALLMAGRADAAPAVSTVAQQVLAIYQPWRGEEAALSPDGAHVAFIQHSPRGLEVMIRVTRGAEKPVRVEVERRPGATTLYLEWADAEWLVAGSDRGLTAISTKGAVAKLIAAERGPLGGSLRVLRVTERPAAVVVQQSRRVVSGGIQTDVLRIDVPSAQRRTVLTLEEEEARDVLMADRQGEVRLKLARADDPQRYFYQGIGQGTKWDRLNRVVADKTLAHFEIAPADFIGHRAIPVDFSYDGNVLYFASNVGRDTYGLYALDLQSGRRTDFAIEDNAVDVIDADTPTSPLVFDRARKTIAGVRLPGLAPTTRWLDPEIGAIQRELEAKFPDRNVTLLEWGAARQQFLVLVTSPNDAGRYFIYQPVDGACIDYGRRGFLDPAEANPTGVFAFDRGGGVRLSGDITIPHVKPVAKPALVVWLHDGPWERFTPGYSRDAQALAAMGFAVARVNYSGSSGAGVGLRQAIQSGPDTVPAADVAALVDWLASRYDFDRQRVALLGEGFGGYVALRAAQLHAAAFRGVVAINAPLDIATLEWGNSDEWARAAAEQSFARSSAAAENAQLPNGNLAQESGSGDAQLDAMARWRPPTRDAGVFGREVARAVFGRRGAAVSNHVGQLTVPVLLLHDPGNQSRPFEPVRSLNAALQRQNNGSELLSVPPQFALGDPAARATAIWRIGEFLNLHVYDFHVKFGELMERD